MGLDYTTYLGPYLQCKVSKTDSKTSRRTCTNNACANHNGVMTSKFCPLCGSPIGEVKFTVKANKVNQFDLSSLMNEALISPGGDYFFELSRVKGIDIWFGNRHRPDKNSRSFSFDSRHQPITFSIEAGVIKSEIDEFVCQYLDAIHTIEKAYGKDNVELKWGLIHYIS